MTLNDLAKYSVTRSVAQSLRQLSFLLLVAVTPFSAHMTRIIVSEMTCNVLSRTLKPAIPYLIGVDIYFLFSVF